jgi:hypothetical protein
MDAFESMTPRNASIRREQSDANRFKGFRRQGTRNTNRERNNLKEATIAILAVSLALAFFLPLAGFMSETTEAAQVIPGTIDPTNNS